MRSIEIKFDNNVPNSVDVIIESTGVTIEYSDEKREKAVINDTNKNGIKNGNNVEPTVTTKVEPKVTPTYTNTPKPVPVATPVATPVHNANDSVISTNTENFIKGVIEKAVQKAVTNTVGTVKPKDTTESKPNNPVASQVIFKRTRDFEDSTNEIKQREKELTEKIEVKARLDEKERIRRKLALPTKSSNTGSVDVKWNVEKIKQFIRDYESMPLYEVTTKYGFETERSCMMTKVDLQSKLRLAKTM